MAYCGSRSGRRGARHRGGGQGGRESPRGGSPACATPRRPRRRGRRRARRVIAPPAAGSLEACGRIRTGTTSRPPPPTHPLRFNGPPANRQRRRAGVSGGGGGVEGFEAARKGEGLKKTYINPRLMWPTCGLTISMAQRFIAIGWSCTAQLLPFYYSD